MTGGGWLPLDLSLATAGAGTSASGTTERRAGTRTRAHRRTVSSLFAELGAMLPNDLPTNRAASQEEIVNAAAKRVRVRMLEEAATVLETYRAVRVPPPRPRPEVAVTVCFSARLPAPTTPGSLTRVLEAFHRRGVEVLVATVARHGHAAGGAAVVTVTASAAPPEVLELIRADIAAIH